jgi:hypothetical protein
MSLLNRAFRPEPRILPEAIERALAADAAQIEPDPLFRRRLRSDVVNRYVATREGIATPDRAAHVRRRGTGRIGRACLYASFSLAATAASVLAAAQEALPGEALYELKLRVEQLRFEVVPDHLHGDLLAYALAERIEELDQLAAAGTWDRAMVLVPVIEHELGRLEALIAASSDADEARIERHLVVLSGLLERLPAAAYGAVEDVVSGVNGLGGHTDHSSGGDNANAGSGGRDPNGPTDVDDQGNGGADDDDDQVPPANRTPQLEATPRPEHAPRPEHTPRPGPTTTPASPPGVHDSGDGPTGNEDDLD